MMIKNAKMLNAATNMLYILHQFGCKTATKTEQKLDASVEYCDKCDLYYECGCDPSGHYEIPYNYDTYLE